MKNTEQENELIADPEDLENVAPDAPLEAEAASEEPQKPKPDLAGIMSKLSGGLKPKPVDTTQEFLGRTTTIAGFKSRPITLATISLLQDMESPLIKGIEFKKIKNLTLEAAKVLVIHQMPLEEAEELVYGDPKALRHRAYQFLDQIEPSKSATFFEEVANALKKAYETQVRPVPTAAMKGGKKETPPKNT